MKIQRTLVLAGAIMLAGLALATAQSTPQLIRIQGFLSDKSGGTPVPANGIFNMIFDLYDADMMGNFVATSGTIPVGGTNGLYEAVVSFPSTAFNDSIRWVGDYRRNRDVDPQDTARECPVCLPSRTVGRVRGCGA